ncbi:unnamed protein product [Hermetia illucens]|uniref:Carbohydrate kinase PfkB domain-containing protein n=1 Tax=Hermetia illucens TaxID=343691 RepID=A0A7R8UUF9_HERIL|nr:ketohexokinase-like [Hermetia illucens]CAD7087284.1 unnamed protein product [Hermetia illucens]
MSESEDDKLILCVGMCVLDIIHVCEQYPQEDTDKRCLRGHWQRGGNASNNCTVLRQLGSNCEFLGVISAAKSFQYINDDCRERGISNANCPQVEKNPPFSSVILNLETHSRTIIHCNDNFPILRYDDFKRVNLDKYKWIHFEGRNPDETTRMIERIIDYNRETKSSIKISMELEKMKEELLVLANAVDYVFLGKDISMHLGWKKAKEAVHQLRNRIDNKRCIIICTWGAEGCTILDEKDHFEHVPAYPPEKIVDTLGAGDTFCAAVIHFLSKGRTVRDSVELGNKVAGFKLSAFGYDHIGKFVEK